MGISYTRVSNTVGKILTVVNQAINYRYTGGTTDVMDIYNWHTCRDICKTLDFDNLYYKYLHQDVCPLRQSNWMLKTSGNIADWEAAVVTGREEPFNPYKERLSVVEKSPHRNHMTVTKTFEESDKIGKLSTKLNNRPDIKQLVLDINSELRNLVVNLVEPSELSCNYKVACF